MMELPCSPPSDSQEEIDSLDKLGRLSLPERFKEFYLLKSVRALQL